MDGATATMESLFTDLTTGATKIFSLVGDVADTIVGEPILLLGVCFFAVGGAVGIFGRLLSRR